MRRASVVVVCALWFVAPAGAHTSDAWQLSFQWPAQGTVTSPFGWDGGRPHSGIDIGILRSPEVRAAAPGVVRQIGWLSGYEGYGNVVLVDVGAPYVTLYAHLARAQVEAGDYVRAGDLLGVAGCTGWCTGTHLHFEVRRAGVAVDPTELFVG